MILFPFISNAAAKALCIELLEAGTCTAPINCDGCIVTFMKQNADFMIVKFTAVKIIINHTNHDYQRLPAG